DRVRNVGRDGQGKEVGRQQRERNQLVHSVTCRTHGLVVIAQAAPVPATRLAARRQCDAVGERDRQCGGERALSGTQLDSPPVRDWTSATPRPIAHTTTRPSLAVWARAPTSSQAGPA